MSVKVKVKEFSLLNGVSPQKGQRSRSRPTTSGSEWEQKMTDNDHNKHFRNIDQAGRKQEGGKQINTGPHSFGNISGQSSYSPSFSDRSQSWKKRTKKLSKISTDLITERGQAYFNQQEEGTAILMSMKLLGYQILKTQP